MLHGLPRQGRAERLADDDELFADGMTVYVCGSAGFADHVTDLLLECGVPTTQIRVERFGPTG